MNKRTRILICLLCFLMVLPMLLSSCANKTEKKRQEYHREEGEGRESAPDSLPDDLDFKGYKYQVFHRNGLIKETEGSMEDGSSAVEMAVYERNERVQARLNCEIEWVPSISGALADTKSQINTILFKRDFYDAIITTNNTCLHLGMNAALAELRDADYIDFNQPWWWNNVIDELSFDGYTINFLVGDMNLTNFEKMSAMYFNFDLVDSMLHMTPEDFYSLVDNKEWTIERFLFLTKKCYKDRASANGQTGIRDDGDLYGFNWVGGETVEQFIWSTKITNDIYTRNPAGPVILNLEGNEMIVDLVTQLQRLFHENEGARNMTGKLGFDGTNIQEFANGNTVFLPQRLTAACTDYLREMETDYGIIPYPLLEEGDDYISWIQDSSTSMCIPGVVEFNIEDFDRSCILLEALCSEAYRHTYVAFFENALKNKYTRDDDAARMVDLIYSTAAKNFFVEYSACAQNVRSEIYNAINNNDSVTTRFASKASAGQGALNKFINDTMAQFG